jgi:hypothetical protein
MSNCIIDDIVNVLESKPAFNRNNVKRFKDSLLSFKEVSSAAQTSTGVGSETKVTSEVDVDSIPPWEDIPTKASGSGIISNIKTKIDEVKDC